MSSFLITGGAGFIGRALSAELQGAGHSVRVLDSLVEQVHGDGAAGPEEVEFVRGDIRDPAAVRRALQGIDGVFHLAAEVGVGQSMYEIERYVAANDVGTAVLFEQLLRNPVRRVVTASSMSIYGEGLYETAAGERREVAARTSVASRRSGWDPVDDDGQPLHPIPTDEAKAPELASVYALSKYVQERLTLMLGAAYGIEAVALRLFNVFGPGQALSNPYTGVLAIFAGRLVNGQPPLIFEDGRQRRDFVHVEDVARAFHLAMTTPEAAGQVFNIGSGRSHAITDVARLLAAALGRDEIEPEILQKARAGDIRHCFADIGKARRVLGFDPGHTLEARLDDLVAWVLGQATVDRVGQAHSELLERGLVA